MRAAGGLIIVGLLGAALFFLPKKAAAKPLPAPRGELPPSAEDVEGAKEAQYAQGLITQAVAACQNPDTCNVSLVKNTAQTLRNYNWTHPDVREKAYKAANDLDAMAQDVVDYRQAKSKG